MEFFKAMRMDRKPDTAFEPNLSEAWLYEISTHEEHQTNETCKKSTTGRYPGNVAKALKEFGIPREECWSEDSICTGTVPESYGGTNPSWCKYWSELAALNKVLNHVSIDTTSVNAIKNAIYISPIYVSMIVFYDFFSYTSGIYYHEPAADYEDIAGLHGVSLIGYDDNAGGTGKGAFELRNSWGSSWALKGYAWMSYELIGKTYKIKIGETKIELPFFLDGYQFLMPSYEWMEIEKKKGAFKLG
jgi:hypothetical protein